MNVFERAFVSLNGRNHLKFISDELCLKILYYIAFHEKLNLDHPKRFNEKIQWLKLNDHNPIYPKMVDKYEAKKYVSEIIGEEYIIPTLGIWDSFDEIDFESLPNQFILKCTHDSGGLSICKDKSTFDIRSAKKKIAPCMRRTYYWAGREWPYKYLKHRIIAEKYMEQQDGEELIDYKVHNFNGTPQFILVCRGRFSSDGLTEDFYSTEWEHLDIRRPKHGFAKTAIEKPKQLEEMLKVSKKLATNTPFLRTDFYIINGRLYFGENTFYPAGGFERFIPDSIDYKLGAMIDLSEVSSGE